MGDHLGGGRARRRPRHREGDAIPSLARPALLRLHLSNGLLRELRRVQNDGARPLRRARLRASRARQSHRPQSGRLVPPEYGLFRLLRRAADDEPQVRGTFRARPKTGRADNAAGLRPRGLGASCHRGSRAPPNPFAPNGDGTPQLVPSRRGRAQLRGEREDPARRALRRRVDPARGGRRGRRAGRGLAGEPSPAWRAAPPRRPGRALLRRPAGIRVPERTARRDARRVLRPRLHGRGDTRSARRRGRALRNAFGRRPHRCRGRRARERRSGGMVPGSDGIRPARAGQPLHPRRRPLARRAAHAQPEGEAARVVPPVRAKHPHGEGRGVVQYRLRQPLYAPHGERETRAARSGRRGPRRARGRRRAGERSALADSGGDPRGLLRPLANRPSGDESALSRAARGVRGADGMPCAGQHQFQRQRGAHRLLARRRLRLLHGNGHRLPSHRRLLPAEG